MAIGVAAQFELALRQKDIIGERIPRRLGHATALDFDAFMWTGMFTWENIPGWKWRMKTSKSKYRAAATFDLTLYGLVFPLLEAVPHAERQGPIIKDETGRPVREGSYRRWFRDIARAAEIPDEVWNMDTRAGAATEAEEAGAERELHTGLTHTDERTTGRYVRRVEKPIADMARLRQASRKKPSSDAG